VPDRPPARRRTISRSLLRAVGRHRKTDAHTIGTVVSDLGDRSFGWSIVLFALINLLPLPIGANMVTSIPLLLLTGQMALGLRYVGLPDFIKRRRVPRNRFRGAVIRLRPLLRSIEKVIRPRRLWLFQPRAERGIGILLFAVSCALFLPIPLSGYIPAIALLVTSLGLVERDGTLVLIGMAIGIVAIVVTLAILAMLLIGATTIF
jgi:hypothetical protein